MRWISVDLSVPEQVGGLADRIGHVDVVVNNAGGVERSGPETLADVAAAWERDFASSVMTAILLTTELLPVLRRPGGRGINVSSIAAVRGGGDSYSAAKAALLGWTYHLAGVLGPEGISVNAVVPGFVEDTEFFAGTLTDERRQRLIDQTGQPIHVNGGAFLGR